MTVLCPFRKASAPSVYATAPVSVTLAAGTVLPVNGPVTNVAIPAVGGTDTTGQVAGWIDDTACTIRFTVVNGGAATSAITINGTTVTSGSNYTIQNTSDLVIQLTTSESGKLTAVRYFTVTVLAEAELGFDPTDGTWYWVTDTYYGGSFTEATGNGTTDDRVAIQSCITAANAATPKKNVYFPPGTYKVTGTGGDNWGLLIPSTITLRGAGATSIIYTTDATYPILINAATNVTLQDFKIDSTKSVSGQAGVFMGNGACSYITFKGLTITDMHMAAIANWNGSIISHITYEDCIADNCGWFGFQIQAASSINSYITFTGCASSNIGSEYASYEGSPHDYYLHWISNLTMTDCTGYNTTKHPTLHNAYSFALCDIQTGTFTDCTSDIADIGVGVIAKEKPGGCSNLTLTRCGGTNYVNCGRHDYGVNTNITWIDGIGSLVDE